MAERRRVKRGITRLFLMVLASVAMIAALAAPSGAYPRPGITTLISTAPDGSEGRLPPGYAGSTQETSISNNGRYVAFSSLYDNLVANDNNVVSDVFVHDRITGKTERVSVNPFGGDAVGACVAELNNNQIIGVGSGLPVLSANGRYVAFLSCATNLVPGDVDGKRDAFLYDRRTARTEMISVSSQGINGPIEVDYKSLSISDSGRFVAFGSADPSLVKGDTNLRSQIFVRDRTREVTTLVSLNSRGEPANSWTECPSISGDGEYVVFSSPATNLVDGDSNLVEDAFLRDLNNGTTQRISVASDGTEARVSPGVLAGSDTCFSSGVAIDDSDRYIAFRSIAYNLVPNDESARGWDSYVHDRHTRRVERVSVRSDGTGQTDAIPFTNAPNNHGGQISIGPDGRFVAVTCADSSSGVCVYDRRIGASVPVADSTSRAQGEPFAPVISAHGRQVAFTSFSGPENNGPWDTFVRDMGNPLGVGGFGGSPPSEPTDDRICITPDVCIPPGAAVSTSDATDDLDQALTDQGANLYGASLAHRPQYEDLFAVIELKHMPQVLPGLSPIFYGLRFNVGEVNYEVRATSLLGGTFGLFDCTGSTPLCTRVADLRGGYGTTGMRIVFSLPLAEIGLQDGGELTDVVAFSGIGSYLSGATKVLDRVSIKP